MDTLIHMFGRFHSPSCSVALSCYSTIKACTSVCPYSSAPHPPDLLLSLFSCALFTVRDIKGVYKTLFDLFYTCLRRLKATLKWHSPFGNKIASAQNLAHAVFRSYVSAFQRKVGALIVTTLFIVSRIVCVIPF